MVNLVRGCTAFGANRFGLGKGLGSGVNAYHDSSFVKSSWKALSASLSHEISSAKSNVCRESGSTNA